MKHRLEETDSALFDEADLIDEPDVIDVLIERRKVVYGEPTETFPRVAQVWSGLIGHELTAEDVTLMMIGYKLVRAQVTPDYSDNSDDVAGYLDIFRTLLGGNMIHARSVEEYIAQKYGDLG